MKLRPRPRWLFGSYAAAVFFTIFAITALVMGEPWFGAAWAWLSGSQWTVAAWLRSERRKEEG